MEATVLGMVHAAERAGNAQHPARDAPRVDKRCAPSVHWPMQEIEGGEPDSGTKRANVRSRSGDGNKSSPCVSAIHKTQLGQPVTWIKAANKSLPALMHGLRVGRTFVANNPTGVQLDFRADVLSDGQIDVGMGGAIPLGVDVGFYVLVTGATGCEVQLLATATPS